MDGLIKLLDYLSVHINDISERLKILENAIEKFKKDSEDDCK
jgi:hypothetical protein